MASLFNIAPALRDLDAIQTLCRRRGWEFRAHQHRYRWFGHWLGEGSLPPGIAPSDLGHCTHAIAIPGCFHELGLLRRRDRFLPLWDDDPEGGLDVALGPDGGILWQSYIAEKTRRAAYLRGHRLSRLIDRLGNLRLRIVAEPSNVAHLRVTYAGATTLWVLGPAENDAVFRYLADALGTTRSVEPLLSELDTAVS
ncbi:MAG: hypothetical protein K2R98_02395 [Gemmataceae bacterium]|nr:hypothetical protein [Gemmataceae bacterium]